MLKPLFKLDHLIYLGRKSHIFVAKGPAYHFTYGRWRFNKWVQRLSAASLNPDDETLLNALDLARPDLAAVKQAMAGQDLVDLTAHFKARPKPVFSFDEASLPKTLDLIAPPQREATLRAADEICRNTFRFRRIEPVTFDNGIDWTYRPQANVDWTWDLNRHAYFETLGRAYHYSHDERYAQKFRELLLDWLDKNPAGLTQPNWSSVFEVAFRVNTWIWAFYYFRAAAAFDHDTCLGFLKGLLTHGRYLNTYIELHALNNHLLLEAKALAMLGLLFPEFKEAETWQRRGLTLLYEQIEAQVGPDGVHREYSAHYQRVVGGELLELFVLLEQNNAPAPAAMLETFNRMVEFELWLTKPNGLIPLLGDSALEDTYLRFSAVRGGPAFLGRNDLKSVAPAPGEASVWLLGAGRVQAYRDSTPNPVTLNSRAFPEGGYFVMRQGQGPQSPYLVFDCGPFGHTPVPVHGHADALSFELYAFNQTLVVDPGVYSTYLGQDWRNFFRSSRAHNTVVVDDQDQSILIDRWRVYRPAQASLHQWYSSDYFDFVDGAHHGYTRLPEPIRHRRQIFYVKSEYWVVIDVLTGRGSHQFDLYFHLMPGTRPDVDPTSGMVRAGQADKPGLIIAPLTPDGLRIDIMTGATNPIQGWVSFFNGSKEPAPALRYRQERAAPARFGTVLYPYPAGGSTPVTVSPLEGSANDRPLALEQGLTGLQIETQAYIDFLVIDHGFQGGIKDFAGYETDASLVFLRHMKEDNRLAKVIMRGGRQLLYRGQSLLEASGLPRDVVLDYDSS